MAANQIGSVEFDLIQRTPSLPVLQPEVIQRSRHGVNGASLVDTGGRPHDRDWGPCSKWFSTSAAAWTFIGQVEAIQGTVVTVYDQWEQQVDNVFVVSVGGGGVKKIWDGSAYQYEVARIVRLRRMTDS